MTLFPWQDIFLTHFPVFPGFLGWQGTLYFHEVTLELRHCSSGYPVIIMQPLWRLGNPRHMILPGGWGLREAEADLRVPLVFWHCLAAALVGLLLSLMLSALTEHKSDWWKYQIFHPQPISQTLLQWVLSRYLILFYRVFIRKTQFQLRTGRKYAWFNCIQTNYPLLQLLKWPTELFDKFIFLITNPPSFVLAVKSKQVSCINS